MAEVALFVGFLAALWILGQGILHCVAPREDRGAFAIATGLTLVIVVVNYLYYLLDLSIPVIRVILLGSVLLAFSFLAIKVWPKQRPELGSLFWTLGIFVFIILPAVIGGEQYYVFRGNIWDHFTYISAALGFARHTLGAIAKLDAPAILSNELLAFAQAHSRLRPSVILLFSLFLDGKGDLFFRAFLYTSSLLAMAYPPFQGMCELIRNRKGDGGRGPKWLVALPVFYIVGFWGQYIFDINAWGQLGSLSLLLAFVAAYTALLDDLGGTGDRNSAVSWYLICVVCFTGSWFIYPESAVIHLVMIAVSTVGWMLLTRRWMTIRHMLWVGSIPVAALVVTAPNYATTTAFVAKQIGFAGTLNDWWIYFDSYIVGIEPSIWDVVGAIRSARSGGGWWGVFAAYWFVLFNAVWAIFGLYFVTPQGPSGVTAALWIATAVGGALVLVKSFWKNLTGYVARQSAPMGIVGGVSFVGLVLCGCLCLKGNLWTAGKLLAYISPYMYIVTVLPILRMGNQGKKGRRFVDSASVAAYVVVVLSGCFGIARVYSATDVHGIGYYRNYPSTQGEGHKGEISWNLDLSNLKGVRVVNVDAVGEDPFFAHYMKLKITYAGLDYFTSRPIVDYFGVGEQLGFMARKAADSAIVLEPGGDGKIHARLVRYGT